MRAETVITLFNYKPDTDPNTVVVQYERSLQHGEALYYCCRCKWETAAFNAREIPGPIYEEMELHAKWHEWEEQLKHANQP